MLTHHRAIDFPQASKLQSQCKRTLVAVEAPHFTRRALAMLYVPSRGMQTQCSCSGRAGWQRQTFPCSNVSWAPNRMGTLASGVANKSLPGNIDLELARMQRSFLEIEKQMAADLREIDKRAHDMQKGSVRFMNPDDVKTYRNEQQFEQETGSGYIRGYRSESITYYGQPSAPLLHQHMQPGMQPGFVSLSVLALMFVIGTYLAVVTRLAAVWEKTRYSATEAARVIPLWPFLVVFSVKFRHEMRAALFQFRSDQTQS